MEAGAVWGPRRGPPVGAAMARPCGRDLPEASRSVKGTDAEARAATWVPGSKVP